jgi:hypothetical protein
MLLALLSLGIAAPACAQTLQDTGAVTILRGSSATPDPFAGQQAPIFQPAADYQGPYADYAPYFGYAPIYVVTGPRFIRHRSLRPIQTLRPVQNRSLHHR